MGNVNGFFTSIQTILTPFHLVKYTSFLSILATGAGVLGLVLTGIYTKRTKRFRTVLLSCLAAGVLCFGVLIVCFYFEQIVFTLIVVSLLGMALYPVVPNLIELACEIVFPIGEATATGFIFSMGQLMSFGLGMIYPIFLDEKDENKELLVLGLQFAVFGLSLLIVSRSKGKL